jgi:hypothetical protein
MSISTTFGFIGDLHAPQIGREGDIEILHQATTNNLIISFLERKPDQ